MTPREELMQTINQLPEETVEELLAIVKGLQQQKRSENLVTDQEQTVLERMGGEPQHLISEGRLSDRDLRRQFLAMRLQQKYGQD